MSGGAPELPRGGLRSACAQRGGEGAPGGHARPGPGHPLRASAPRLPKHKGRRNSFLGLFLTRITGLKGRNHGQDSRDRKLKGQFILKDKNPKGSSLVHQPSFVFCSGLRGQNLQDSGPAQR